MTLESIHTSNAPAAIGPYSQAVTTGQFLFVSGQLGMNPENGELVGDDLKSQARQALENLEQVVLAGGSNLENVMSVDAFLTSMDDFPAFNDIYTEFFSTHKPARAVVEVSALPKGACVEVKCMAMKV